MLQTLVANMGADSAVQRRHKALTSSLWYTFLELGVRGARASPYTASCGPTDLQLG